jgi:hypothetical protein
VDASTWFEDIPVVGKLPPDDAAAKLREVGDTETAAELEEAQAESATYEGTKGFSALFKAKPYQHTAHAFGYLAPTAPGSELLPIQHAGNIVADPTLKNSRIKITLDRLRVADYPGSAMHRVLFDFYAQNQVPGNTEHLHFNLTCRVREGEQAAVLGYPIFVGLNVGGDGIAFKCFTVNVSNDSDEAFLAVLESDVFKEGLKLVSTAQPAIAPLAQMALGVTKAVAARNRNVAVQDFYMGLDFTNIGTRARLCPGSYLAVQIPENLTVVWDWNEWGYNPANGQVVNKADPTQLIPYNYVVFSVSRYEE